MHEAKTKIRDWKLLSRKEIYAALPWIKVYLDTILLPSGRVVDDYHLIEAPHFAMVCAHAADGKILLERQYKYAVDKVTYCLPAGLIEKGEAPLDAAKRELVEETGYRADTWVEVGEFPVDPNRGGGTGHFFIAGGIEKIAEPVQDDMEDIEVVFLSESAMMEGVLGGDVLSISSIALLMLAANPAIRNRLKRKWTKGE